MLIVGIAAIALLGASIVSGSWYTIDQRERGVILRNGKLIGTATPGLGFKLPFFDSIVKISLETQRVQFDKVNSYSRDQQPADLLISVNYRATEDKVDELYAQFGGIRGYADRVLLPKVQSESKIVFGQFNAVTAIQERGRLNAEVMAAVLKSAGGPVVIESVQIENLDFSKEYEKSIEQRMLAEVEVQRLRQNAEREKVQAEIVVTKATAEANAVRQRAQAESEAIRLRGEAEASAIRARGAALGDNPNLVTLVQAEKWDGRLPVTMLPGGAVPMLNLDQRAVAPASAPAPRASTSLSAPTTAIAR
ncbi:prohibitin family protein [Pseudorhodoplanes sinuspersici]|uniref:Band 7 protein n=1 Tax=Pseudorhodoplanes sinuspersici TaxID=1235591 RepID=A0A1W7A102_9HYPH|nr:prohibitin family protein [Pseudorhodoplanes sinuspersici]ARQ03101.1 Band 7 protein [Pseudorhodoplanes sinuspersici]